MDEIHRFNKLQQVRTKSGIQPISNAKNAFILGHFFAACRERNDNSNWSDHRKSVVQFEFGIVESMSCNCFGETEHRKCVRDFTTVSA